MKDLQARHKEWSERNFGQGGEKIHEVNVIDVISYIALVGEISHHTLKAWQGVRGTILLHESKRFSYMKRLIARLESMLSPSFWNDDGVRTKIDPSSLAILGISEEVGELAAARSLDDKIDAVGDIVLYLLDYCNKVGIDFEDAVRVTAEKVHKRDWVSNPVNGEVGSE